jgi:hypothetical protein
MAIAYQAPVKVRLQFSKDTVAWAPADAIATSLEAQWQRAYIFWDCGYSTGLKISWGALTGELTATDLMLGTGYDHTTSMPGSTLWLPGDLTPLDGSDLATIDIDIFMDALGAAGTAFTTFKCVARPEQVSPQQLAEGLVAAQIAWRWEIRDDLPPVITS